MHIRKQWCVGGRQPGNLVLEALHNAVSSDRCQLQWIVNSNAHDEVVIRCTGGRKSKKPKVVEGVKICVASPINPQDFFGCLLLELTVEGLMNIVTARQYLTDFEIIERAFGQFFAGRPKKYCKYNHQQDQQVTA